MPEETFSSLSYVAGPAILTNACAVLQNGVTTRYNLAIAQWRDFRTSLAAGDGRALRPYADPATAVALAARRVRLQLRSLALLNTAVALFAATTVLGLAGAAPIVRAPAAAIALTMAGCGTVALLVLLAAAMTFFLESACGTALLRLHRDFAASGDAPTP